MTKPLWQPSTQQIEHSQLTAFMNWLNARYKLHFDNYSQLHAWSISKPADFWLSLWHFCEITHHKAPDEVMSVSDHFWQTRWFSGARLNYAANLLTQCDDSPALIFRRETGERRTLSYRQLNAQVAQLSNALRNRSIQPGDRVAGIMANTPETVIAMLACASIGAIWSSCSPDFGPQGIIERFAQIEPVCVFATEHYFFKGHWHDCRNTLIEVARGLPDTHLWVRVPPLQISASPVVNAVDWQSFLAQGAPAARPHFTELEFDHPLAILFSSGTTGAPKCIVHTAGGTLLQHLKEHRLHLDLKPGERIFYYTTCGWMMWNWLISALASHACLVLYDGAPLAPAASQLWQIAEQEKVNVFGISARYLVALEKAAYQPVQQHNLTALRMLLSTGSPLSAESFKFAYRAIKRDMLLGSISGGTDIVSCFALSCPIRPVYAGQLQCAGLGMAVSFYNETGQPTAPGEQGELVCTRPFPSMPKGFWNDPDQSLYRKAYFERFPGVWAHGDYGCTTGQDGVIINGRSDATLNPGGVRIGTAEIYRVVEQFTEVSESLCVGLPDGQDEIVLLFICLTQGQPASTDLIPRIKQQIGTRISPRHIPTHICIIDDLPRTRSGKLSELAVKKLLLGEKLTNTQALANPEALEKLRTACPLTRLPHSDQTDCR